MPVAAGVAEPFQHEHAGALGHAEPGRVRAERPAPAVGGERALAGEFAERLRGGEHGDTAGERQRALPRAQRPGGQVQGHQRGGAGRVDRDGRSFQPECVGEAAGRHAREAADERVPLGLADRGRVEQGAVVVEGRADEDAGVAAAQRGRRDAAALDGLPGHFEQQPLLRVHGQGLARADAEEVGVEAVGSGEEPALGGVGAARGGQRGVDHGRIPAAVGGQRRDDVPSAGHDVPELFGRAHLTREAAGHGHDDDRVPGSARGNRRRGGRVAGRGGLVAEQFDEPGAQPGRGRVVEEDGGGQRHTGRGRQAVAQLDGGQRVEADLPERPVRVDAPGAGQAEHGGGLRAHEVEHGLGALCLGQPGEAVGERVYKRQGRGAPVPARVRRDTGPRRTVRGRPRPAAV